MPRMCTLFLQLSSHDQRTRLLCVFQLFFRGSWNDGIRRVRWICGAEKDPRLLRGWRGSSWGDCFSASCQIFDTFGVEIIAFEGIFNHWFSAESPVLHYLQSRVKDQIVLGAFLGGVINNKETVIQLFQWDLQNNIVFFHFGNGGHSYISHCLVLVISGSKCGGEDLHFFFLYFHFCQIQPLDNILGKREIPVGSVWV